MLDLELDVLSMVIAGICHQDMRAIGRILELVVITNQEHRNETHKR